MKRLYVIPAVLLAAGCMAEGPVESTPEAEAGLSAALQGRSAGAPLNCVATRDLRGNRSIGEEAILFQANGDLVYLNRPSAGCLRLEPDRALRSRSTIGHLCAGDIVTVYDPRNGTEFGGCTLGAFVPYRR